MPQTLLAALVVAVLANVSRADDATRQQIISFSENVKKSFKPARTRFLRQSRVDGRESEDMYIENGESFLYENETAVCAANEEYSSLLIFEHLALS